VFLGCGEGGEGGGGDSGTVVPDCSKIKHHETRINTPSKSSIAVVLSVDSCSGDPLTGLQAKDFKLSEDGKPISKTESQATLLQRTPEVFISLVIDNSPSVKASGSLNEVVTAALAFTDKVMLGTGTRKIYVGVWYFSKALTSKQSFTRDKTLVQKALNALLTDTTGSNTTNLYGTMVDAVANSTSHQTSRRKAMKDGVLTLGQIVMFTDGADTAALKTLAQAEKAVQGTNDDIIAIALGGEIDKTTLSKLGKNGSYVAKSAAELKQVFAGAAQRATALQDRIYVLGYCSPKLAGTHQLVIEMANGSGKSSPISFDASKFGDPDAKCSTSLFQKACDNKTCGGLLCGGCPENATCSNSDQCVCPGGKSICGGKCVDTRTDANNCGKCSNKCASYLTCQSGNCLCLGGKTDCSGKCVDTKYNINHCGKCGNKCASYLTCQSGSCLCPGGKKTECSGKCVDTQSDSNNCGKCNNACPLGSTCQSGICLCSGGKTVCSGLCVDIQTDGSNCGKCGNKCSSHLTCQSGSCQCPGGKADCGGQCVDTKTDVNNCGQCGNKCLTGAACQQGLCWVVISPGKFQMGSPLSEPCRLTNEMQHQVTLTNSFEIMNTEVTQGQFSSLMGYNPSFFPSCGGICPVEQVSWHDAVAYCNALSTKAGLMACYTCSGSGASLSCQETTATQGKGIYNCKGYRLPTEAEWEYAYRAGTTTAFYNGGITSCSSADSNANSIAWYRFNSKVTYPGCKNLMSVGGNKCSGTHPVGKKTANAWGLYDMAGNVFEWCHDRGGSYPSASVTDPVGTSGVSRVLRGGSWYTSPNPLRAAIRGDGKPTLKSSYFGFRCSRTIQAVGKCNNGKLDPGEPCDGNLLGGKTCKSQGYLSGTLKCTATCTLDFSGCVSCTDKVKNGLETDVDCGGGICPKCAGGKKCIKPSDCQSGVCSGGSCKSVVPGSWVTIAAGKFTMGSPASDTCRGTNEDQHQVTLSNKFAIQSTEVTQDQFKAIMTYNPSSFTSCGGTCPVEQVTWHEAVAYCNALSLKEKLTACYTCSGSGKSTTCNETPAATGKGIYSCKGYRLPTDAEWEYAYRAGTTTDLYNGSMTNCKSADTNADKIGWYLSNASSKPHLVGKKAPNAWGLYDMAGNVWEWCHDGYMAKLGTSAVVDPVFAGSEKNLRSGSWKNPPKFMRAAARNKWLPTNVSNTVGFRCVKTVP